MNCASVFCICKFQCADFPLFQASVQNKKLKHDKCVMGRIKQLISLTLFFIVMLFVFQEPGSLFCSMIKRNKNDTENESEKANGMRKG